MVKERAQEDTFIRAFTKHKEKEITPDTSAFYRDRRRHPRFKLSDCTLICYKDTPLKFLLKKNIAKSIYDLSKSGLRFTTDKKLPAGTHVYIKFNLPKFSDSFEALGKICWIKEIPKGETTGSVNYYVGVSFTNISENDANKIEHMRSWFTSPHSKLREKSVDTDFLKFLKGKS